MKRKKAYWQVRAVDLTHRGRILSVVLGRIIRRRETDLLERCGSKESALRIPLLALDRRIDWKYRANLKTFEHTQQSFLHGATFLFRFFFGYTIS